MSDELNNKERVVKDLLTQAEFDLDVSDVWSKLEGQLPVQPEKKRRIVPYWWMLGLLLVGLSSLYVGYQLATMQPAVEQGDGYSGDLVRKVTDQPTLSVEAGPREKNDVAKSIKYNASSSQSGATRTTAGRLPATRVAANPAIAASTEKPLIAKSRTTAATGTSDMQEKYKDKANSTSTSAPSYEKHTLQDPVFSTQTSVPLSQTALERDSDINRQLGSLASLPMTSPSLVGTLDQMSPLTIVQPLRRSKFIFAIGLRGGAYHNMSSQTVTDRDSELDEEIFAAERGVVSSALALDATVEHRNGWRATLGLGIHDAIHRYARTDQTTETYTKQGTAYIIIDDEGQSQAVSGDIPVRSEVSYDLQWHRRHRTTELHAGVGKTLWASGIVSIGADVIVGYAVQSTHTGYDYDPLDGSIVQFVKGEPSNYQKNIGWSAALLPRLTFHLGQTDVSLIPVWRYQLSPLTNNQSFYKTTNSQLGLQLGLTYRPAF